MDDKKVISEKILALVDNAITQSFVDAVINRLASFGYEANEDDVWAISFSILKVDNRVKNSCNTQSIPDGLFHVAVDMVCGDFLLTKKQSGQLDISGLDFAGAVTQISEGDTSVSFSESMSDEEKFNQLISYLISHNEGEFACYRQIKW